MTALPQEAEHWLDAERWAWTEITAGRPADFDARYGKTLDPSDPVAWDDRTEVRMLTPAFLDLAFKRPLIDSLAQVEIKIKGAWVQDSLRVQASLPAGLTLENCRVEKDLLFFGKEMVGPLHLYGLWLGGGLWCTQCEIDGNLRLEGVQAGGLVNLDGSVVKGDLFIGPAPLHRRQGDTGGRFAKVLDQFGGRFPGGFSADELVVEGDVHFRAITADRVGLDEMTVGQGVFGSDLVVEDLSLDRLQTGRELRLYDVAIGNQLSLSKADIGGEVLVTGSIGTLVIKNGIIGGDLTVTGRLPEQNAPVEAASADHMIRMESAEVEGDLYLSNLALEGESYLLLPRVRVKRSLRLDGVSCRNLVDLVGAEVGSDLIIEDCAFRGPLNARLCKVDGSLALEDSDLDDVSLSGATIARDLSLGRILSKPPRWRDFASLDLRNATVGALQEGAFVEPGEGNDPWPARLDLRGLEIAKLVSFGGAGSDLTAKTSGALIDWLGRDPSGSLQPYVMVSQILRRAGAFDLSNDVLYAGRERTRRKARSDGQVWRASGLWLLKWTIGYGLGLRYFRVLGWVALLVALGVATLWLDQRHGGHDLVPWQSHEFTWMVGASLDSLLPIVTLDRSFAQVVPSKLAFQASKIVFWLLSMLGWMLGSFLVAGLAGLTQKPS